MPQNEFSDDVRLFDDQYLLGGTDSDIGIGWNTSTTTLDFRIGSTGTVLMSLTAGGRLAFGTAAPAYKIHMVGGNGIYVLDTAGGIAIADTANGAISIKDKGAVQSFGVVVSSGTDYKFSFENTAAGTIKVGVNTATPTADLDVVGTASISGDIDLQGALTHDEDTSTTGDTTPSVSGVSLLILGSTGTVVITSFDDPVSGQVLRVMNNSTGTVTLDTGDDLILNDGTTTKNLAQYRWTDFLYVTNGALNKWLEGGTT